MQTDKIFGLGGAKIAVPLVWRDRVSDPNAANGQQPPHPIWGSTWQCLAEAVPDDFEQTLQREPELRGGEARGWRWLCPRCGRRARSVLMPTRVLTIVEWLDDREVLERIPGADAVRTPEQVFACTRCHRVRHFTALTAGSWNELIATMSGCLLFGSEVARPSDFKAVRCRVRARHKASHPRCDELERLLIAGKSYAEAAEAMDVKLSTVQGHVKRLYARRGVHSRRALVALWADATQAVSDSPPRAGVVGEGNGQPAAPR